MNKLRFGYLLVMIATTILGAQSVAPPPRPQPDGPSLASILESLKQTLLASGEVKYTQGSYTVRSRVSDVVVNAADCRVRVSFIRTFADLPTKELSESYFLEAIDSAEVMTLEEASHATTFDNEKFSAGYETVINHTAGQLQFTDRDIAARVAELLQHASAICRATPVTRNSAAGKPGLPETLSFIEQKLIEEGAVGYQAQSMNDSDRTPSQHSERALSAQGEAGTCMLRYRLFVTYDGKPFQELNFVISFRRVQKLEVMTHQQSWDRSAEQVGSTYRYQLSPTTYQLQVTQLGRQYPEWVSFRDEDTADRVAKAMNHAAELCRPENKEPF